MSKQDQKHNHEASDWTGFSAHRPALGFSDYLKHPQAQVSIPGNIEDDEQGRIRQQLAASVLIESKRKGLIGKKKKTEQRNALDIHVPGNTEDDDQGRLRERVAFDKAIEIHTKNCLKDDKQVAARGRQEAKKSPHGPLVFHGGYKSKLRPESRKHPWVKLSKKQDGPVTVAVESELASHAVSARAYRHQCLCSPWRARCYYCEVILEPGDYTVDHFHPRSKGGRGADNRVAACVKCNQEKGDKVDGWFKGCRKG